MARIKRAQIRKSRKKKIFRQARGYYQRKKNALRTARDAVEKSMQYATAHRRERKGDMRRLWNTRISAAVRMHGLSYSRFMRLLKEKNIALNRKILSHLAATDLSAFQAVLRTAQGKA